MTAAPAVVVQRSDPHIGADWGGRDPAPMLAAALERVLALDPAPAAVVVSGDIAEHAADAAPLRLVVLDSTRPGEADGELDELQLRH